MELRWDQKLGAPTPDPRAQARLLTAGPEPLLLLVAAYLAFVCALGPRLMRGRSPLPLRTALVLYNGLQVVLNAYVLLQGIYYLLDWRFNWRCMPPLPTVRDAFSDWAYTAAYHYLLLKVLDLADTVFMVLRKNQHQVTFLHLFHHTATLSTTWAITRYSPGGNLAVTGVLNTFVHVVMYAYYLLTALDPQRAKAFAWKRHITHLQMAQLAVVCVHMGQVLVRNPCGYPTAIAYIVVADAALMLGLFANFYVRAYVLGPRKVKTAD